MANNSRFLIDPSVRVPHLASHVLSRYVQRVALDWEERYGYAPVLADTSVDGAEFAGTSYRAANWTHVGQTAARSAPEAAADWAEEEFGRVAFYDQRLKQRLYHVAGDFYAQPGVLVPQASNGVEAKVIYTTHYKRLCPRYDRRHQPGY